MYNIFVLAAVSRQDDKRRNVPIIVVLIAWRAAHLQA